MLLVGGLVSGVDKPTIPGGAFALAGYLFPVEPSLVSDLWPLQAPQDSRQQGAPPPSAASTANRKNNAAAVLAAGEPALALARSDDWLCPTPDCERGTAID